MTDLELMQLELDAMRYRWLRDEAVDFDSDVGSPWVVFGTNHEDQTPIVGESLDDAVDNAMNFKESGDDPS
jgi:hypothetical protein